MTTIRATNYFSQLLYNKNNMLRNLLIICLVFWESEPQYAYKRYAYKKTCMPFRLELAISRPSKTQSSPRLEND